MPAPSEAGRRAAWGKLWGWLLAPPGEIEERPAATDARTDPGRKGERS